ncbi:LysM peptidoglycan-binding domain-containing protein [Caldalkalibacillus mannanilyticus]|uniref:LysM peptidoglycan-binding domain-containing protein n=1 Tax=Caldalkalibacillus mannanilyticus TaxID=1418 RepID=UPI0006859FA1|nr:LysM peptidoglycan-binding domain-containing protein [Caldalkalibacillus mannanilyticus]
MFSVFDKYQLVHENGKQIVILYLKQEFVEFSHEFGLNSTQINDRTQEQMEREAVQIIEEKFPRARITMAKIMLGTMLVSTISFAGKEKTVEASEQMANTMRIPANEVAFIPHTVVAGDTLFLLAKQYQVSIEEIRSLNNLSGDTLQIGQVVRIPQKVSLQTTTASASTNQAITITIDGITQTFHPQPIIINGSTFIPIRGVSEALGASVAWNGRERSVEIVKDDVRIVFTIGATIALVNGKQVAIPASQIIQGSTYVPIRFLSETMGLEVHWDASSRTVQITTPQPIEYHVVLGDSLWSIANQFQTSVDELKEYNSLTGDRILVGQTLLIPPPSPVQALTQTAQAGERSVTYTTHVVQRGDNAWDLSVRYGIPMSELLRENQLTTQSILMIGQALRIPVYHIPIKPVVSARHGELLDWWTEAQYVFTIGKTARVTDFATGRSFHVKRTVGANHADSEPLTAQDAQIMREIWGGSYSWQARAIIVEVDGRRLAASMHSMPHGVQYIHNNNYNGHFCIHFLNSTLHMNGQIDQGHQGQIRISSGTR